VLEVLEAFVAELRAVGIPVSMTENIDAAQALRHISLADREAVKTSLAAVMVKDFDHYATFATIFDLFFSSVPATATEDSDGPQARGRVGSSALDSLGDEALIELLERSLQSFDRLLMSAVADQLVDRRAGMEPGREVAGTYYLFRALSGIDFDGMTRRYVAAAVGTRESRRLTERLAQDEFDGRVDRFREEVEAEIRRRLVADRGVDAVAKTLRRPLPEDASFVHASRAQMAVIREAVAPLTRKLATTLARRRRHRRKGPLDFRRTVRHSLSTGGVPAEPVFRRPRPAKPELVVIADISGSVAAFAAFTLQLMYALRAEFSKVRSFVFVDGVEEITDLLEQANDISEVTAVINQETKAVWLDGRSDYGHALEVFWERWGQQVRSRSTAIVLGDARNNYHSSRSWALKSISERARHVYWLNPEPEAAWNDGDSIMQEYAKHCDGVFECRNLRQLRAFVEQLE
jgi:uncharacterized protein with von Willebrand factor type A (vWA) domain